MGLLQITLRILSICIFPLLVISIFLTLHHSDIPMFLHHYLTWILLLFIVINWISWEIWGSIVTIIVIIITTIYMWLITKTSVYPLEIIPAFLLILILKNCEERTTKMITLKQLEKDDKEREYNQLLQEHKKQECLRESFYKKARRFSRLSHIAKELGFLLTPEEINRNVISNLSKTIENGDIYILCGIGSDLQNLELQILESPSGILPTESLANDEFNIWVMRHRQPLIITDISKDYRFNTSDIMTKTRSKSLIISPLITGDRLLGIIRIDSYKPDTFTVDDLRLLTIISNIGALTIYNAQLYKQTEYLAIRDDLTGLYVKGFFHEGLEKLIAEGQIKNEPFCLLLLDLDRFKDLNDQFGHSVGDKVLQKVSLLIKEGSGPTSIAARYGGEEFAVILPHTTKPEARSIAERIRKLVEEYTFSIRREGIQTTISIGLSEFPGEGTTSEVLIDTADKRLYEAKRKGRNKVIG